MSATPELLPLTRQQIVELWRKGDNEGSGQVGMDGMTLMALCNMALALIERPTAPASGGEGEAYFIGALAMAHYYHMDYASGDFARDHAERAMRAEHLEWAKQNTTLAPPPSPERGKEGTYFGPTMQIPSDIEAQLQAARLAAEALKQCCIELDEDADLGPAPNYMRKALAACKETGLLVEGK